MPSNAISDLFALRVLIQHGKRSERHCLDSKPYGRITVCIVGFGYFGIPILQLPIEFLTISPQEIIEFLPIFEVLRIAMRESSTFQGEHIREAGTELQFEKTNVFEQQCLKLPIKKYRSVELLNACTLDDVTVCIFEQIEIAAHVLVPDGLQHN